MARGHLSDVPGMGTVFIAKGEVIACCPACGERPDIVRSWPASLPDFAIEQRWCMPCCGAMLFDNSFAMPKWVDRHAPWVCNVVDSR